MVPAEAPFRLYHPKKGDFRFVKLNAPNGAIATTLSKREVWEELCRDHELLERLKVTPAELDSLRNCAFLGSLTGKDDMLFILRMMRAGNTPDFAVLVDPDSECTEHDEESLDEPEESPAIKPAFDLSTFRAAAPAPESLAAIARVRVPEQLTVFALIIAMTFAMLWYFVPAIIGWQHHFWGQLGIATPDPVSQSAVVARVSEYRLLLVSESVFVLAALTLTHWFYRAQTRHLKVRPY